MGNVTFDWHLEGRVREIGHERSCWVKALAEWTKTRGKKEHSVSREHTVPTLLASALRTTTFSYSYVSILLFLINGVMSPFPTA